MRKITCPICKKKSELITDWNDPILSCGCRLTPEEYDAAHEDEMFAVYVALTEDGLTAAQALDAICRHRND